MHRVQKTASLVGCAGVTACWQQDPYLSPITKPMPKWIKDLNINPDRYTKSDRRESWV